MYINYIHNTVQQIIVSLAKKLNKKFHCVVEIVEGTKLDVIKHGVHEVSKTVPQVAVVGCLVGDPVHWWEDPPVEGEHTGDEVLRDARQCIVEVPVDVVLCLLHQARVITLGGVTPDTPLALRVSHLVDVGPQQVLHHFL